MDPWLWCSQSCCSWFNFKFWLYDSSCSFFPYTLFYFPYMLLNSDHDFASAVVSIDFPISLKDDWVSRSDRNGFSDHIKVSGWISCTGPSSKVSYGARLSLACAATICANRKSLPCKRSSSDKPVIAANRFLTGLEQNSFRQIKSAPAPCRRME